MEARAEADDRCQRSLPKIATTQQEIDAAAATLRQAQAQVLQTEAEVAQAEPAWVLTSCLVANGIVLTISGWLSAVIGRKHYFLIRRDMFTVCSHLCGGIAGSLAQLIVFQLLQDFFGGGLQPGQQSIIIDTFPPEKRGAAFGVTAIATVVAPVLGPTLGGFNTDTHDWRWIFFANLPVGMMAVFFVSFLVEDPPWHTKISRHVDDIGLSLIKLGFGCLQVMFDRGEDQDWLGSPFIRTMAVLAILGILGAISWLLIAKKPDVSRDVFKDKNFAMGSVCMAATRWASPVHQPFNELIARSERTLTAMGRAASAVDDIAVGNAYQVFRVQAAVLAYSDVYRLAAVVAFARVPFSFFLSGKKGCGGAVH